MRLAVVATDAVALAAPAAAAARLGGARALFALLLQPALVLIDHGHCQFNSAGSAAQALSRALSVCSLAVSLLSLTAQGSARRWAPSSSRCVGVTCWRLR
jgi:hypothetical protein